MIFLEQASIKNHIINGTIDLLNKGYKMDEFLDEYRLINVKTTAMGSLYQLTYEIVFKNNQSMRLFVDELRCRNSNFNISLNLVCENN